MGLLSLVRRRARLGIVLPSESIFDSWLTTLSCRRKEHSQNINQLLPWAHSLPRVIGLSRVLIKIFKSIFLISSTWSHTFRRKNAVFFGSCFSSSSSADGLYFVCFWTPGPYGFMYFELWEVLYKVSREFTKIAGRGFLFKLSTFSKHVCTLPLILLADYLFASYKLKYHHYFVLGHFGVYHRKGHVISTEQTFFSSIMLIQVSSAAQQLTVFPVFHFIT